MKGERKKRGERKEGKKLKKEEASRGREGI